MLFLPQNRILRLIIHRNPCVSLKVLELFFVWLCNTQKYVCKFFYYRCSQCATITLDSIDILAHFFILSAVHDSRSDIGAYCIKNNYYYFHLRYFSSAISINELLWIINLMIDYYCNQNLKDQWNYLGNFLKIQIGNASP